MGFGPGGRSMRSLVDNDQFLREIQLRGDRLPSSPRYPFDLPVVKGLKKLPLHPAVTFLVGENGSGKSTLLEAVAVAWGLNPEGGSRNFRFETRASHSDLFEALLLVRGARRARDSFFLRAETLYNVATEVERLGVTGYGGSLHECSHGEAFLRLFMNRFRDASFFVLDEPEAALSPTRQLAVLARMHHLVGSGSQFLIATHSPILMGYPNSWIYQLNDDCLERVRFEETDHYLITRRFLDSYPRMVLDVLRDDDDDDSEHADAD
jgi:predicted ATPase